MLYTEEVNVLRSVRQTSFETFLDATHSVTSIDQLFDLFVAAMAEFGYDRINFSIKRDDDIPAKYRGFGLINTYPEVWRTHYQSQNFARIDPVLRAASSVFRPFQWSDLSHMFDLTREQVRFMRIAEEAGLYNGIGIPFSGPRMQIAGVAMATSVKGARPDKNIDLLVAYCWQLYRTYKRLVSQEAAIAGGMTVLSARECEILVRIGNGRTDRQIAQALSISTETVDANVRRIFQKLEVPTRAAAVAKALILGLIEV